LFYMLTLVLSVAPGWHDLYLHALSWYESYIYLLLYSLLNYSTTIVGKSSTASSRLQEFDKSHVGDVGVLRCLIQRRPSRLMQSQYY
jgi:hypothetical protein